MVPSLSDINSTVDSSGADRGFDAAKIILKRFVDSVEPFEDRFSRVVDGSYSGTCKMQR